MTAAQTHPFSTQTATRRSISTNTASVGELPCECSRPGCRATVLIAAESHRGVVRHLIVSPLHSDRGTVVRAADRYFVLEVKAGSEATTTSALRAAFRRRT